MAVSVAVVCERKCIFDWLLKKEVIEGEINQHPLHACSSIEEEVECIYARDCVSGVKGSSVYVTL